MVMRAPGHGAPPITADQLTESDRLELSDGRLIHCQPTGARGGDANGMGYAVVRWDPAVKKAGVDTGFSPTPHRLRAPDVSVGDIPDEPGWVKGAPKLAIEYADIGQDDDELKKKIRELFEAGTRYIWVVRLSGPRRVEVHEPGRPMRLAQPDDMLAAPGVLQNPVPVRALYDADEAARVTLRNLLQRQGYEDLEAVLARGQEQGEITATRDALLRVLDRRGLALTEAQRARIAGCADLSTLQGWLDAAITAATAREALGD